ncbi:hypothetical protein ACLGDZ_07460 [Helicobacter pylori]
MWSERFLKIIPAVLFLFCILEVFELGLIITDMNKTEKLEAEIRNDLKMLGVLLNEYFKDKKIKIK